eukprot:6194696-Pleurochrysis_carterae.AAC.1
MHTKFVASLGLAPPAATLKAARGSTDAVETAQGHSAVQGVGACANTSPGTNPGTNPRTDTGTGADAAGADVPTGAPVSAKSASA